MSTLPSQIDEAEQVSRQDIDFFTKQVSLLLGAGLSLDKALRTIRQHSHKAVFGDFVGQCLGRLVSAGAALFGDGEILGFHNADGIAYFAQLHVRLFQRAQLIFQ